MILELSQPIRCGVSKARLAKQFWFHPPRCGQVIDDHLDKAYLLRGECFSSQRTVERRPCCRPL
jgi:hypothetical protein